MKSDEETANISTEKEFQQELKTMSKAAENIEIPVPEEKVTIEDALKIFYCLMAVDGDVSREEEEKFDMIGREMDPEFSLHKDSLIKECTKQIGGAEDPDEYYDAIHDYVSDIIRSSMKSNSADVRGKLLLWNLLAIVYSDSVYSEEERRLIRYICRTLRIEKSVVMEMEQAFHTLSAIAEEEKWIRTTDRQFKMVEERLNELADRKMTIMQSVYALISD